MTVDVDRCRSKAFRRLSRVLHFDAGEQKEGRMTREQVLTYAALAVRYCWPGMACLTEGEGTPCWTDCAKG